MSDLEKNKIVNEKEGFQIYFKGLYIDLNKNQKKINVTAQKIVSFFTQ